MHTLRSAYLTSYTQLIKPPYTSDPFPAVAVSDSSSPVLASGNRETRVLDLYIALKVREDVWMDETELHLERDECFKDLFDLMQVRFLFTVTSGPRNSVSVTFRLYPGRVGYIYWDLQIHLNFLFRFSLLTHPIHQRHNSYAVFLSREVAQKILFYNMVLNSSQRLRFPQHHP